MRTIPTGRALFAAASLGSQRHRTSRDAPPCIKRNSMWVTPPRVERTVTPNHRLPKLRQVAAKNGERAGSPAASCVWPGARSLGAAGLHAVLGGAICVELPRPQGGKGRAGGPRMKELSAQYPR